MTPLISILIPAYNVEEFLAQCLESVVNQTHKNLQVIVVDDGSSDNTWAIAEKFRTKYDFVETYRQENQGVSIARKHLLSRALGEYVLFVDGDDWIEHDMVERLFEGIKQSGAEIAICGNLREESWGTLEKPFVKENLFVEGEEKVIEMLLRHNELNGSLCNKLVPRKFYHDLYFNRDIWYGEDCYIFWQAINNGVKKLYFMKECLYHYRMNDQSITHIAYDHKKMSGHLVWKKICDDVQKKWPSLSDLGYAAHAVSDMWLLYYAGLSDYKCDENIREFQKNVRHNLKRIYKSGLIAKKKFVYAVIVSFSYRLGNALIKTLG